MNWDAVGAIAEGMGALGVVATLAYLAVQIRHATAASRTSAFHEMAEASANFNDMPT